MPCIASRCAAGMPPLAPAGAAAAAAASEWLRRRASVTADSAVLVAAPRPTWLQGGVRRQDSGVSSALNQSTGVRGRAFHRTATLNVHGTINL